MVLKNLQVFLNVVRPISPALLCAATIPRVDESFSLNSDILLDDTYWCNANGIM